MFEIMKRALTLDIFDVNYYFGKGDLVKFRNPLPQWGRPGIIVRIISFLRRMVISLRYASFDPGSEYREKIIFLFTTKNQKDSLLPIRNNTPNSILVGVNESGRLNLEGVLPFPVFYSYLISLLFLPVVVYIYLRSRGDQRASFRFGFDSYLLVYGHYVAARFWLARLKPTGLVIANDHSASARAFTFAARHMGVLIFYAQHASVIEKFPPLMHDYALLEGIDALEKYENCGPSSTKVFLVGMPRFDRFLLHVNNKESIEAIGLCTNMFDPLARVEELCKTIRQHFRGFPIYIRPHPGDKNTDVWMELTRKYDLEFSDPRMEVSFELFRRVDAVIAGDSNIHLEAALMNIFPIYYDFGRTELDWYGFRRNGLVEYYCEPGKVVHRLKELSQFRPSVREKAKRYCATTGTVYDGHSIDLASGLVQLLSSGAEVEKTLWTRVPGSRLEAYQINPACFGTKSI
jgi:hypothetical protein